MVLMYKIILFLEEKVFGMTLTLFAYKYKESTELFDKYECRRVVYLFFIFIAVCFKMLIYFYKGCLNIYAVRFEKEFFMLNENYVRDLS